MVLRVLKSGVLSSVDSSLFLIIVVYISFQNLNFNFSPYQDTLNILTPPLSMEALTLRIHLMLKCSPLWRISTTTRHRSLAKRKGSSHCRNCEQKVFNLSLQTYPTFTRNINKSHEKTEKHEGAYDSCK